MDDATAQKLTIPLAPPIGDFVHAKGAGAVVAVSGQLPIDDGKLLVIGRVGDEVTLEEACAAARLCVVNGLRALQGALGEGWMDQVSLLRLTVYIACGDNIVAIPTIADAASAVAKEVLGARGICARSAIGVARLPANAPVEVELTFISETDPTPQSGA